MSLHVYKLVGSFVDRGVPSHSRLRELPRARLTECVKHLSVRLHCSSITTAGLLLQVQDDWLATLPATTKPHNPHVGSRQLYDYGWADCLPDCSVLGWSLVERRDGFPGTWVLCRGEEFLLVAGKGTRR